MPLDDQIAQRRANFQAIGDLGVPLYPNAFDATASVSALVERHGASSGEALEAERPEVRVAGRVLGIRAFGKASFLVLSDGVSTIQAYLRQDALSERDWAIYKHLDFGDQVGVAGRVFRSKTNELSVWASSLSFLAKCFLPLPEKWHGLQDVETRYRQRYLDLAVNPESRRVFEVRSRTVSAIRRFFEARGFLEVETPMMQPIAGGALARPVRDAPQRPRHEAVPPHRAGAVPEAPHRRRHGARVRDQPQLPQRRRLDAAQPRVHDARVLPGLRRVPGPDGAHRDAGRGGRAQRGRDDRRAVQRPGDRAGRPVAPAVAARRRRRARRGAAGHAGHGRHAARPRHGRRRRGEARDPRGAGGRRRQDRHHALRDAVGGLAGPAHVRLRLPDRGVAAVQAEARRPGHRRALRALHRRLRSGQRVQRAERSGGAAPPLRGPARPARRRRPGSAPDGRGLRPRARVRPAADRRGRASASTAW